MKTAAEISKFHTAVEVASKQMERFLCSEKHPKRNAIEYINQRMRFFIGATAMPLFFITEELTSFYLKDNLQKMKLIEQLIENDLFISPFPDFVIEFQTDNYDRVFSIIEHDHHNFKVSTYALTGETLNPAIPTSFVNIENHMANMIFYNMDAYENLGVPNLQELKQDCANFHINAMLFVLLLNTKGITKDRIEAPKKLNEKRIKKGKCPISDITIVKIGHYYDKQGNQYEYTKASPRIHWRRGHMRTVHFGQGKKESKQKYILPCLVNYNEGDEKPEHKIKIVKC